MEARAPTQDTAVIQEERSNGEGQGYELGGCRQDEGSEAGDMSCPPPAYVVDASDGST